MASAYDNVNADFAGKVRGLIAESGGRIKIVSGFRSGERQQQLWGEALRKYGSANAARQWVAPPGRSNHEKGTAFDLGGDLKLAHMLAPKYGLSFPMGHEPWHIEPSGLRSKPGAHTTPPGAAAGAAAGAGAGDDVVQNAAVDPVDSVFKTLNGLMSGTGAATGVGEASVDTRNPVAADAGAPLSGATAVPTAVPGAAKSMSTGGDEDVDRFMSAIMGKESGGNFNATNKDSGASGAFQIMPANWSSWAAEAGLGASAPRSPENQNKVAKSKMQSYYKKFGNWRAVAEAWYGGPGAVGYSAQAKAKKQGKYPSIQDYANDVLSRMGG